MNADSVARARELCAAATEGEWTADQWGSPNPDEGLWFVAAKPYVVVSAMPEVVDRRQTSQANAEFIAAARTLLPEALDTLETAVGLLDDLYYGARGAPSRVGAFLSAYKGDQ